MVRVLRMSQQLYLHVKEGCASVWPADAEHTRRANLLQCQKEHGFAKDGPPAAPEATGIICSLLVLELPTGCLK